MGQLIHLKKASQSFKIIKFIETIKYFKTIEYFAIIKQLKNNEIIEISTKLLYWITHIFE